jgi:MYXO-CTERM domain-containing protein
MSQINRRGTHLQVGLLAGLGALLLQTSPALATPPVTFMIADGGEYRGENEPFENTDNEGAGIEQMSFTTAIREGRTYVISVYMSSNVDQENAPNQVKCTSVLIDPLAGPQIMADQVYLTDNQNTDQPGNHPVVFADAENILFAYGYAENNGNTQTYVRGIDHMCNSVTETKRVSNNNNNNQGAPDIIKSGVAGRYQVGYYDNNDRQTYVRDITISAGAIENVALNVVIEPANIGRPSMASDGMNTLVCTGKGENRPPEDGVACAFLNNTTGELIWANEIIAESQPNEDIYMNQASVALLSPGRFAVNVVESTGMGKNTNAKGGSKQHIYMLEPNAVGPNVRSHATNFGVHAVHGAIVTGMYSETGEPHIGLFEAPVTGSGLPVLSFFNYDSAGTKFGEIDTIKNQWVAGATNADSGYLNNIYGNNPGTQGREFLRAMGNVANPGALIEDGWMNEVETFFVVGYGGMALPTDTKNHGYLTFIPGKTKVPVVPESPTSLDPADVSGPTGDGAVPPPPAVPPETVAPPAAAPPVGGPGQIVAPAATGACSASTEGTSRGNMAGLVALGLALVGLSRRRRAN